MVGNFLYVNRGGKRFEEMGLAAGIGYSMDGVARSGMGVDAADVFENGRQALFLADIDQEIFSLYKNNGDKTFDDESWKVGIGPATRMMSGRGLKFFDYDNDGLLDLILSGGHPDNLIDARGRGVTYRGPMILFHNEGNEKFLNVSEQGGEVFKKHISARGLVGTTANPDAIGAIIKYSVGGKVHSRMKNAGGSFISSHDPRIILGLGKAEKVDWVEIHWPRPSQRVDRFTRVPINRYIKIVEGAGIQEQ